MSQGTLVIPFDPPQTQVAQEFAFVVADDAGPSAPLKLSCVAETAAGALAAANLDLLAADLVEEGRFGTMAALRGGRFEAVPLADAVENTVLTSRHARSSDDLSCKSPWAT